MDLHTMNATVIPDRLSETIATKITLKDEGAGNGSTCGTFQSKDPNLRLEKDSEAQSGGDDGQSSGSCHTTSYFETLVHYFKGNMCLATFALGDAFKNAGLILAPPLMIFLGVICVHAQHTILNCNEVVKRKLGSSLATNSGYAATLELCFATGPLALRKYSVLMRKLVNLFLCITQLGFCCVSFVFISSNVQQVMKVWGVNLDVHVHMAIMLIPMLFSTWIRNLKYMVPLSLMANVLIVFGYFASMYVICHDLPPISKRRYVADWRQLPLFFGTAIYSFEGIALIFPLKNEMKNPKNFDRPLGVMNVGVVITGSMLIIMGFLSYLKYGEEVAGSVTLNLEPKDLLPQCIKLAISLSILMSYALQFYVPIGIMWPEFVRKFGPFNNPVVGEILFRTMLCLATFFLAEVIPQLGLIISLVGAASSSALALIFPPIAEIVICWQNEKSGKFTFIKNVFILAIGVFGSFIGTYISIKEIIQAFGKE